MGFRLICSQENQSIEVLPSNMIGKVDNGRPRNPGSGSTDPLLHSLISEIRNRLPGGTPMEI